MMKIPMMSLLALLFLFASCDDNDLPALTTCGDAIIMDTNYSSTESDGFAYTDIEIIDNCLTVTIQYAGGCGDDLVSFQLLGSTQSFPLTLPALFEIKLILDDNDDCEALVTKSISFDLEPLQDADFNNINIAVEGWNNGLQYSY
ncbi:MAG: hypothetical protein ACI94Y_004031 [Maribacter sp.]|jgi:hypothetical protein